MATKGNKESSAAPAEDSKAIVERVQDLCKLAASDNENEARSAAMQAVRLMNEHELAFVPRKDLDRAMKMIDGAQALAKSAEEKANQKLVVGLVAGAFLGKQFL